MVRTSITMSRDYYDTIKNYALKLNKTFSQAISELAIAKVNEIEQTELLNFLQNNCSFASADEQAEFDNMDLNLEDTKGKEIIISK